MILQADIILSNVKDGKPGEDGKSGVSLFKSYAFKRTDSDISGQQPTGGTWDNPVPTGWSDGIPAGTETLWQTVSTFKKDADGNTSNTAWTNPAMVGNTSDLLIFYSDSSTQPSAPTSNIADGTVWKETATENTIWMAQRVKKDGVWQAWTVIRVKGENGADGTSVKIKGTCLGHYATHSAFQSALTSLKAGVYLIDENTQAMRVSFIGGKNTSVGVTVEIGDGYLMSSSDANLDGHLWMATDDGWQDCGKIKGDDGKDGQNGKNAVHYELRDNGSIADITIEDDKIKLTASLSYDLYRVDGTTEAKTTGTVTNDLDGGLLLYSNEHYVKTISKEYTNIDSLPASVITTAKVNNTVVATAVCKVSMGKTAYWNVDAILGRVTSMATDNENNISLLQQEAKRISAKVGGMANPNLLINSGFTMTSNGIPSYWEIWDDNKAKPAVTLNGDNCKIEVKATGMYQGIRQMRKMQLHSPLKLTFSCVAKGSGILSVMLHKIQGSTQTGDRKDFKLEAGAKLLSCTFELSQYIDSWRVMIGFVSPNAGNNVTFYNPKLEIGEAATQWCENENDRVLATGIDIEKRKVTVTADRFKIIDNAGQDMMSVEKCGTSSRVRLRNLMVSGLTLREVVTLNTWSELRKYFSFDVQTLAGTTTATSTLNFQTCLNTFKLGSGCLVGRESGDTQDWNYQLNIVLPCRTYSASPTDADLAEMDNAMMYVGNRVILLNQSGRGISVFGRQEVEHMTTYQITSTNKGTVVSSIAKPSLVISKGVNLDKTDGRTYSTWNGSLTDTRGYYVPTIQSDGVTVKYKYTKYWTTDESWYVPNGWFALMECVCDVDAEYAQDEYSNKEPVQGQSVFWRVKVGKMLTK